MRYVLLAYKSRLVEPRLVGQAKSVLEHLGEAFEDLVALGHPSSDPDEFRMPLCSSGTGLSRNMVLERIELGDGRVMLRSARTTLSHRHAYVYVDHDWLGFDPGVRRLGVTIAGGVFMAEMESPGVTETFREIRVGSDTTFALETHRGLYVTAEGDGNGSPLTVNRNEIGEWQLFHYVVPPEEFLPPAASEPTIKEQSIGTVQDAQTQVEGIPADPRVSVQDAATQLQRPDELRDSIFRRPGT